MFQKQGRSLSKLLIATPLLVLLLNLAACDQIQQKMGIVDTAARDAHAEEEGRAVGGACRHSGRAIEDCYSIYAWLPKAAIYNGWRDMDAYMRENKIETIEPVLPPAQPPPDPNAKKKKAKADPAADAEVAGKEAKPAGH